MSYNSSRLGDITKIKTGKLDANVSSDDGQYPFFTCAKQPLKISSFSYDCECVLVAGNGDLNVKYYNGKFDAYQRTYIIESTDKNKLDTRYLYYFIDSYLEKLREQSIGGIIKYIKLGNLTEIQIPLPPLSEQKRIADILDKADELRQKRQQSIEKLDELLQATFIDMFGDPVTNPKGWDVEKLDNLMTIVRGGSPRPIEKFLGGDYPWIKIGDATKGDDLYISKTKESITEAGLKKTRLLPEGSLIFANCGVSLGFARILKIQGCIHDGWLAFQNIDEERVNKIFLLKALNSVTQFFRDTAPDGTQPNLNTAIMKEFKLIIPPMIEQLKFEQIVYSINEQKEKLINQLFNQEYLFQSLQQRAFNGEL